MAETSLIIRLLGDNYHFRKSIMEVQKLLVEVGTALVTGELLKAFVELNIQMEKLAQIAGTNVSTMAGLSYAAHRSELDASQLAKAMKALSEHLVKTGQGSRDLKTALLEQSAIFQNMPDGVGKVALATERFGKAGVNLIPFLNQGPEAMQRLIERGEKLSGTNEKIAQTAHDFKDSFYDVRLSLESFVGKLSLSILPAITDFFEKVADKLTELREAVDEFHRWASGMQPSLLAAIGPGVRRPIPIPAESDDFDKAEFEARKKRIEQSIKDSELIARVGENDHSLSPADRLHLENTELGIQIGNLEKLRDLTGQAKASGIIEQPEKDAAFTDIDSKIAALKAKQKPESISGNVGRGLDDLVKSWGTAGEQIAHIFTDTISNAINSVSSALTGVIMQTKTWSQALMQIGNAILTKLIDQVITFGLQWAMAYAISGSAAKAFHAVSVSLGWAQAAQTNAQQASTAPGLAVNAANASTTSYGTAAIIGIAAMVAAIGIGLAAALGAFEQGGFTGMGGTGQIAGVVHGQEFVFSAPAVQRIGRANLESLHAGSPMQGGNGGAAIDNHVHIGVLSDRNEIPNWIRSRDGEAHVVDIMRRNFHTI